MCDCPAYGGGDEDEAHCRDYESDHTNWYGCEGYVDPYSGADYSGSGYDVMKTQAKQISNTKKIHRPQNKSKSEKKVGNQLRALLKMLEMVQKK